jgi:hypothetical protein
VLIDWGGPDQRVVEVTAAGWEVRLSRPGDPLFTQSAQLLPLPEPERGGTLDPLWGAVHVHPRSRPLLANWMASALLPDTDTPILLLRGEQGTGKSTAAKSLLTALDPCRGQLAAPPGSEREWPAMAAGRAVMGLDNLSVIQPWFSDVLCRGVTGDYVISRRLYTDGGQYIAAIHCALILTSIDPGAIRGDLAERMLPLELERFAGNRRGEDELLADLRDAAPKILAGVLDRVVAVLRHRAHVPPPPRQALGTACPLHGPDGLLGHLPEPPRAQPSDPHAEHAGADDERVTAVAR